MRLFFVMLHIISRAMRAQWHTHWCDMTNCHGAIALSPCLLSLLRITLHSIDWERAIYLLSINQDLVLSLYRTCLANPFVLQEGQMDSSVTSCEIEFWSLCFSVSSKIVINQQVCESLLCNITNLWNVQRVVL